MNNVYDIIPDWEQEYCGIVLDDGQCIRLLNYAKEPSRHFELRLEDAHEHSNITGIWHTHIDGDFNLSIDDYQTFIHNPEYTYFIVTKDKIAQYSVEDNLVFNKGLIDG